MIRRASLFVFAVFSWLRDRAIGLVRRPTTAGILMDRLNSQESRPVTEIEHAAIAVRIFSEGGRHIGVLYRDGSNADVILLHLAWHHDLRNESPHRAFLWLSPSLPQRRLRQVAAMCRKIWRSNGRATIPYAFSWPSDSFDDETGEYLLGPTRRGLTCASFVLAVFEAAGLRLVNYESWPVNRTDDHEWQEWVITTLETSNPPATAEHIAAVKSQLGAARFRPEEVAGAALVTPLPVEFEIAAEHGLMVLGRLRAAA